MKKFLLAALLVTFGVGAPIVLLELGFRVAQWSQNRSLDEALAASENSEVAINNPSLRGLVKRSDDPKIVFELKRNISGTFLNKPLRTNSYGMRYPQVSLDKPADTIRIALIGDSIAFGWGVAEEERYSSILEKTLSQKFGKKVEVLNFGVPGYNSAMEAEVVQKNIEQFHPDILLLHFVNNDDSAPYFLSENDSPFALNKSFLYSFIKARIKAVQGAGRAPSHIVGFGSLPQETKNQVMQEYAWMVGPKAVEVALDQIGAWCNDRHIKPYIVFGSLRPGQFSILRRAAKNHMMTLVGIKKYVEQYFIDKGITDREERFKALTLSAADPHPNANGHAIYAQALLDSMTAP